MFVFLKDMDESLPKRQTSASARLPVGHRRPCDDTAGLEALRLLFGIRGPWKSIWAWSSCRGILIGMEGFAFGVLDISLSLSQGTTSSFPASFDESCNCSKSKHTVQEGDRLRLQSRVRKQKPKRRSILRPSKNSLSALLSR